MQYSFPRAMTGLLLSALFFTAPGLTLASQIQSGEPGFQMQSNAERLCSTDGSDDDSDSDEQTVFV